MPFDALTLSAIRHDLQNNLVGGRIQSLLMPGPLTVALEIYRSGTGRTNLLMSAHAQQAGIYIARTHSSRDPQQHPPLLLLLRKYIRGGTLISVSQPPFERVLALSIAKRISTDKHQEYHSEGDFRDSGEEDDADPGAPIVTTQLIIEIMGRLSNIVLIGEDGVILDSIKRVPPSINRYRITLPRHNYVPPPAQEKRDASRSTANAVSLELSKCAAEDDKCTAWKGLVAGFLGVSPLLAKEAVFRSLGAVNLRASEVARDPEKLRKILAELQSLLALAGTNEWQPCVAWKQTEGEKQALDFAPYRLTHLEQTGAHLEACPSISEAIELFLGAQGGEQRHSALRAQIGEEISTQRKREESKLRSLREELQRAQAVEELRRKGELLLAYMHTLQPGQTSLAIPEENITIQIDLALSPVDNAQAFFREYRKAQAANAGLPERIADAEMNVAFMDELLTSLDLAAVYDEVLAVQQELRRSRQAYAPQEPEIKGHKGRGKKGAARESKLPQPLRLHTSSGAQLLLGRTSTQNDVATFRLAAPDDLWFHARGVPGAHVILRSNPELSQRDIEEAAAYAAGYSALSAEAQADVIYTEKKHVRKVPNSPPGFATFRNERTVRVAPKRVETRKQR